MLSGIHARAQVAGSIAVYPGNASIETGSSRQYSAYVPISPNTVTWMVNDVPGGNSTFGTVSPTGLYVAPASAPANNLVIIKVQSTAYPASVGTATLKITRPYPWLWSVYPSSLVVGNFQVSLNGSNFAPDSIATANGMDFTTTYVSPTKLTVSGAASQAGTLAFAVRQPGNGAVTGNSVSVTVKTAPITVTLSPTSATVPLGASKSFTATVSGSANTAVTWLVNDVIGGNASIGTISTAGVYTAPATLPASSTVAVKAVSSASSSASATATVTLQSPAPTVAVTVTPAVATVSLGTSQSFSASVVGSANTAVTWSVNGINGGNSTVGIVSANGLYTAPSSLPASSTVTVRATSVANPASFASATISLVNPPPPVTVAVTPFSASVPLGTTQAFLAAVSGSGNTAVTWSVNGITGGNATLGTISAAGLYSAPSVLPASGALTIRATSVANGSSYGQASVTLTTAPIGPVTPQQLAAGRFLEQSSFGPSPSTLAAVMQQGVEAYLEGQFALPATVIPLPAGNDMAALRQWALHNYTVAPDQLRQRVAYTLGQIIVTSGNKLVYANEIIPWMRLLSQHAFGNYRDLLHDVTVSPSMGKFLDLANSMKPGAGTSPNENYPRELLQLFSIGLWQLNQDGSQVKDANNSPIPSYTQDTVAQLSLALTGWTYATAPGATPQNNNWEYFGAPMESRPQNHATVAKSILGATIPANQTVEQDLESVLDILMNHPNTAPFVATRMIRSLVMSNPSPGYIQRVADVFVNNGYGVRGDLKAVVRAILLDAEARNDVATVNQGKLKEPLLEICGLVRSLNGQFSAGNGLVYLFDYMAQPILSPPSVFSWFSPMYRVPKSTLFGPEFQIYSPTEATLRGNFFYMVLGSNGGDVSVDLTPFQPFGNDMPNLVEKVNQVLLHGRMPAAMKQALITAATPGYDAKTRIETVLYLTSLSGLHAVQY